MEAFRKSGDGTNDPDMCSIRKLRTYIMHQTKQCVSDGAYHLLDQITCVKLKLSDPTKTVATDLTKTSKASYLMPTLQPSLWNYSQPLCVEVVQRDILEVANEFSSMNDNIGKTTKHRVAVLNMASQSKPGGGYLSGAGAQEENLHRRSDLYRFLAENGKSFYPLGNSALVSEDVSIFRSAEAHGYAMLPAPFKVCVITCAAPNRPDLCWHRRGSPIGPVLTTASRMQMKRRITTIFTAAKRSECDIVLLSAFGCGAFKNPPRDVAEVFHEVLTTEFHSVFSKIIFCIFDDHNGRRQHNPEGNFKPFHDVFSRCSTRKRKAADQHDGTAMKVRKTKGPLDGECVDSSESETSSCTHDLYRRRCNRSRSRASVGVVLRVCLFSYVVLFHCA